MSDALKTLHQTMLDTRKGYETATRDADAPALKRVFDDMIALRDRDHAELHRALADAGEAPDDGTSLMATIHKAAVDLRASVTGLDRSALGPFISGEEKVLEQYDAAISNADAPVAEMLERQKSTLLGKIAEMRVVQR